MAEPDVIELLKTQHERIRTLFDAVDGAPDSATRQQRFDELRALLAVHETAEELVTHPRARMAEGGGDVVDARLEEEHEAKKTLAELDEMGAGASGFVQKLRALRVAVLDHAEAEEREEFPLLAAENDQAMLDRMATAVRAAEAIAPTHPHPSAGESMVVNAAVGPLVGLVDRTRDAVTRALRD